MPHYKDTFKFNVKDIELIEEALRNEIHTLSNHMQMSAEIGSTGVQQFEDKIKELHQLLGKIHNQKIWYGQVHHTGVPISG